MALRWYVVHAFSQYEKKVAVALKERIERFGMEDRFGEIIVPTEEVIEMKGGQKRKSERKFFPGYVLVQMELGDDTWHLVKDTPRVLGFIGGKADRPAPITEAEANAILQRVEASTRCKMAFASASVIGAGRSAFPPIKPNTRGVSFTKCHVSSPSSICTSTYPGKNLRSLLRFCPPFISITSSVGTIISPKRSSIPKRSMRSFRATATFFSY